MHNFHPTALTSPNGGELWVYGKTQTVQWDTSVIKGSSVTLYVLHDDPLGLVFYSTLDELLKNKNWYQFANNIPNTGSYSVDPASLNGNGNAYVVLIVSDSGDWDISDNMFTLTSSKQSNSDNGGSSDISYSTNAMIKPMLAGRTLYMLDMDGGINSIKTVIFNSDVTSISGTKIEGIAPISLVGNKLTFDNDTDGSYTLITLHDKYLLFTNYYQDGSLDGEPYKLYLYKEDLPSI